MVINGLEANALLFAFDAYFDTVGGELPEGKPFLKGYDREALQDLRDRLMAAHEHPKHADDMTTAERHATGNY